MVGEIWILLGSARLHFMKGSADELLLRNKSSACSYTSRGANVTVQCCWKDFLCLSPVPHSWLFSHCAQESCLLVHQLCFFIGHSLGSFWLTKPAENCFWWKKIMTRKRLFFHQRWAVGSADCAHEAVVSATSLLGQRLTAETMQLLAQSSKDVLPGKGKQLMGFGVIVGFVEM